MFASRKSKAIISSLGSLTLEVSTLISGLIIPKIIISTFGSNVNGLICSITQFLGYLSFFQLGVGGVIRAALYNPLANNNTKEISSVIKASDSFYHRISIISLFYIVALSIIYPIIKDFPFSFVYISSLIWVLGLESIAQYALGFSKRQLLYADQRSYIFDLSRAVAVILNVVLTVALIFLNFGIHFIKAVCTTLFVLQPVFINLYSKIYYRLKNNVEPNVSVLKNRFTATYYSLAEFVHKKTDILVLTLFSTLEEISVYSIYLIITIGINQIISMATHSFQAALGNMYAKKETDRFHQAFRVYVLLVHLITAIVFTTNLCMINSFVKLYVADVSDANYYRPVFSFFIVSAEMLYCFRTPYQAIIFVAGHFKETQNGAIIEAVVNLVISVALVFKYGIVGVAIGTVIAMTYRTFYLAHYLRRNIVSIDYSYSIKRYAISIITVLTLYALFTAFVTPPDSFYGWAIMAAITTIVFSIIVFSINSLFYPKDVSVFLNGVLQLIESISRHLSKEQHI